MSARAFFLAAGGFALGVFVSSLYALSWLIIFSTLSVAAAFFVIWFFSRRGAYALLSIVLVACALGGARVLFAPTQLPSSFAQKLGTKTTLSGTISSAPDVRDTNQRIIVSVSEGGETTRVLAVVSSAEQVSYGERVRVRGKLLTPKPFATKYGRTFHYGRYLAAKGVFALMPRATLTKISPPSGFFAYAYGSLILLKHSFLHALGIALPEPAAALAGGLVVGGTQGLGAGLTDDFVRSGLIHIVVLSGYNVMIVADAVLFALLFLPRKWAAGIAAAVIGAFVLVAGAGAASIRAGLMALFALAARASGRTYDVTRALVVAALLMLLWNPLLLVFNIGFDLSVVATFGLILGVPLVEPKLAFIKYTFLRETMAATFTAQIAVLPLLLYANGLFSFVALPANLLVLPLVPLAMAAAALAGLGGFIFPAIAHIVGLPAYALLSYFIKIVHGAASLPLAALAVPQFSFALVVLAYALLAFFAYRLIKNKEPTVAYAAVGSHEF